MGEIEVEKLPTVMTQNLVAFKISQIPIRFWRDLSLIFFLLVRLHHVRPHISVYWLISKTISWVSHWCKEKNYTRKWTIEVNDGWDGGRKSTNSNDSKFGGIQDLANFTPILKRFFFDIFSSCSVRSCTSAHFGVLPHIENNFLGVPLM